MYSLDFIIHKTYVYTDNPNFSTKIINFGRFNTKIYSSKLTQLEAVFFLIHIVCGHDSMGVGFT
jgi:hypothetical protein